jgi:hypothetical protein
VTLTGMCLLVAKRSKSLSRGIGRGGARPGSGRKRKAITLRLAALKNALAALQSMAAAQSGNMSIGGIASQAIVGGAGGAILTALVGAIKNKAAA